MIVEGWEPADGCKSCKQAEKGFKSAQDSQMRYHAKAMKKLKEKQAIIDELVKALKDVCKGICQTTKDACAFCEVSEALKKVENNG